MSAASRLIFTATRALGLNAMARRLRPGAVVLCYHNVVATDDRGADRALHLPVEDLRAQLAWVQRHFEVVTLDELYAHERAGRSLRGLAAITFDDAYRGCIVHGRAVLRALGLPATVFVPTAAPDSEQPFWWDLLPPEVTANESGRARALEELAGDREAILAAQQTSAASGSAARPLHRDCLPATWAELAAAQDERFQMEAHSVTHRTLPRLDAAALRRELDEAAARIEQRLGRRPTWLAYPYGRFSPDVAAAARASGYRGGFTLSGQDLRGGVDWSVAPRLNIPAGISLDAFAAWLSGFAHLRASRR